MASIKYYNYYGDIYQQPSNESGVGYIDNYDGLQFNDLINSGDNLKKPIVIDKLPTIGIESQIYLVENPDYTDEQNHYIEYMWIDGKYEIIGYTDDDNLEPITKDTIDSITG